MDGVDIRTATDSDLDSLRAVFRRSSWSNEGDRPLLTENPHFLVLAPDAVRDGRTRLASIGGRVVGFVSLLATADDVELEDLFVDPDSMRRGIGRALVDDVAEHARRAGATRLAVDANDHARLFYAKAGFVEVGRVALEHGAATRMILPLRGARPKRARRDRASRC